MKKGTYDIRLGGTGMHPVVAWEFELFGIGTLIVHRDIKYPKKWTVSEPRTGASWGRNYASRKKAIEEVSADVHIRRKISKEKFEENVRLILHRMSHFSTNLQTRYYTDKMKEEEQIENE